MCGIAGAFSYRPEAPIADAAVILAINDAQHRRGPDGSGLWQSPDLRVTLGHRRLAIIDTGLSGSQPMTDKTGRWTITFNGAIYNYQKLRIELQQTGVHFLT